MNPRVIPWVAVAFALGACEKVTSENIQKWKGTEKGPGKLEEAFTDAKLDPRLRAEAAVALGEIEMHMKVLGTWKGMPEAERSKLAPHMVALHASSMAKGSKIAAREARDGLFELRDGLTGEPLQQANAALAKAMEADLREGRVTDGRHTVPKIAGQLGADAVAPAIERVLQDPAVPFAGTVELVSKLADEKLKHRAGAALAKRVQAKPEQPKEVWAALITLGGPQVTEFLKAQITGAPEAQALVAAQAFKDGKPGAELAPFALEIAGNPKVPAAVREEIVGLLEGMQAPGVIEGLTKIIADEAQEQALRYRAFAAIVNVGKAQAVGPALEAFPQTATFTPEDVATHLVLPVTKLGDEGRSAAFAVLESQSALARMVAVLALESVGAQEDAKELTKRARDRATVNGFPKDLSVGKAAARVAVALKTKPLAPAATESPAAAAPAEAATAAPAAK